MSFQLTNLLLEALSAECRARLLSGLEAVPLPVRTEIFDAGQEPRYVHFLTSGIASIVTGMAEGEGVEVGLVGRAGFPECIALLGPLMGSTRCFMQVSGTGLRMDFKRFQQEFLQSAPVRNVVLQYVQSQAVILAQLAACNRLHEVEERLARWLLMAQDQIGEPVVPLTQEFLAEMLGTRRSTVTVIAGMLQRSGLIEYSRGRVRILDREGLESAACECYAITQKIYGNLYR